MNNDKFNNNPFAESLKNFKPTAPDKPQAEASEPEDKGHTQVSSPEQTPNIDNVAEQKTRQEAEDNTLIAKLKKLFNLPDIYFNPIGNMVRASWTRDIAIGDPQVHNPKYFGWDRYKRYLEHEDLEVSPQAISEMETLVRRGCQAEILRSLLALDNDLRGIKDIYAKPLSESQKQSIKKIVIESAERASLNIEALAKEHDIPLDAYYAIAVNKDNE